MPDQIYSFAERFWDIGNYVVGFAVAQMLTFLYALGQHEIRGKIRRVWKVIIILIILSSVVYARAVWRCYDLEAELLRSIQAPKVIQDASRDAFVGRITIIGFTGIVGMLLFLVANWDEVRHWVRGNPRWRVQHALQNAQPSECAAGDHEPPMAAEK